MTPPSWLNQSVSRETMYLLDAYAALVEKWNPRINLVSKASLAGFWERHIWDSAQVADILGPVRNWADFGSGGGLPAVVLAILSKQSSPDSKMHMVESDQRKCAFLRTAVRELSLNASVTSERIENMSPLNANVISARALTDLNGLLGFADQHLAIGGTAIFPKGESWEKELSTAQENWSFQWEAHKSFTNPSAVILKIEDIKRV